MNENRRKDFMEDISSFSKKSLKKIKNGKPVTAYGGFLYNRLAKVIKVIAYIVAIANLICGLAAAVFIFRMKISYIALSFFAVLVFAAIGTIAFFVIYGIGHSIEQNNEILKRLS